LEQLGLKLPEPPVPVANFSNFTIHDNMLYLSGQGPVEADGTKHCGKAGRDVSLEEAKMHARLVGINLISVINTALNGDLDRVDRVIKIVGFVNSDVSFFFQPEVINGCSDLLVEVFGERGSHARTAIGVAVLPFNITVEIEAIVALK
jgi:enamine deaminase RidA (YjgF/YER057c/UK114 family)